MVSLAKSNHPANDASLTPSQLTKEEEAAASGEDMEVRREDQEKINRFSSLHQKEEALEEELRGMIVCSSFSTCLQHVMLWLLVFLVFLVLTPR